MRLITPKPGPDLRSWLVMGRAHNLPTVWSNCIAAWLLGGGDSARRLAGLVFGATLVYIGGAWLNDHLDIEFDRQHHPNRPLPTGRVVRHSVGKMGVALLGGGASLMVLSGAKPIWVLLLLATVLVYDLLHKATKLSPVLMAACRLLLYLAVASAAIEGVTGFVLWCAIAMAAYISGLSYLAAKESSRGPVSWWPLLLLAAPVVLALVANGGEYAGQALWLSFVLALWVVPCLRHALREGDTNKRLTVSGLTSGIVLVDLLATAGESAGLILGFAVLFVLTIGLQRYVPEA